MGDAKEGLVVSCADTIETYRTHVSILFKLQIKVEKILNGSLNSIPSHSPSLKIQIMGGKVCLMCKGKTLLGIENKKFVDIIQQCYALLVYYPSKLSCL